MYVCIPLFVAEIADQRIRGKLGSMLMFNVTFGILGGFVAGYFLNYFLIPKLFLVLPLVFLASFPFLPETPQYHIAVHNADVSTITTKSKDPLKIVILNFQKARKSLKFYRNCQCEGITCAPIEKELAEMQHVYDLDCQRPKERVGAGDLRECLVDQLIRTDSNEFQLQSNGRRSNRS